MTKLEKAARQALDTLEDAYENGFLTGITGLKTIDVLTALREALAKQALQKLSDFHQSIEQWPTIADLDSDVGEKPTKEELADVLVPWYDRVDSTNALAKPDWEAIGKEQEKPLYRKVLREMLDAHEQAKQAEIPEWVDIDDYEEQKQEPVAWVDLKQWQSGEYDCFTSGKVADYMTPLYAAPVRTKDLTGQDLCDLEIAVGWKGDSYDFEVIVKTVIAKFKEKNNVK